MTWGDEPPLLTVDGLSKRYGANVALDDIGFALWPGEVLAVVGESGSGKSITALAMMGLLPRGSTVSGHAWLDEGDVLAKSERELCDLRGNRVGMISRSR